MFFNVLFIDSSNAFNNSQAHFQDENHDKPKSIIFQMISHRNSESRQSLFGKKETMDKQQKKANLLIRQIEKLPSSELQNIINVLCFFLYFYFVCFKRNEHSSTVVTFSNKNIGIFNGRTGSMG